MVEQTQTIRRQELMNCLSVFDHFVGLALKGLSQLWLFLPNINKLEKFFDKICIQQSRYSKKKQIVFSFNAVKDLEVFPGYTRYNQYGKEKCVKQFGKNAHA